MNKTSTLKWAIALLAILNIALMVFLWSSKSHHKGPHRDSPRGGEAFIQQRFGWDDAQLSLFVKSKKEHGELMKPAQKQLFEVSRMYYLETDTAKQSILNDRVLSITEEIYQINQKHLNDIRSICTPAQLPEVENFIDHLVHGPKGKGHRGRKKGRKHSPHR